MTAVAVGPSCLALRSILCKAQSWPPKLQHVVIELFASVPHVMFFEHLHLDAYVVPLDRTGPLHCLV